MARKDAIPHDVYFIETHEYFQAADDGLGRVGISDYAADQLGDVVFVELPETGETFEKGEAFGTIESVKAASDLYMPVSGEIIAVNLHLSEEPSQVNDDPYKSGWMIEVALTRPEEIKTLMDREKYAKSLENLD